MITRINTPAEVHDTIKQCKEAGLTIDNDDPEYVKVRNGSIDIFVALKKDQTAWICRYNEEFFGE